MWLALAGQYEEAHVIALTKDCTVVWLDGREDERTADQISHPTHFWCTLPKSRQNEAGLYNPSVAPDIHVSGAMRMEAPQLIRWRGVMFAGAILR